MVTIEVLLQYLFEGDFLGLLQAIYVSAFQSADLFYGFLTLLLTSPIYLRTKSLLLLCILWILIGGFLIATMPLLAGLAIFLMVFGLGTMLFKVFIALRS